MTKPKSKREQDLWKGRCNHCGDLLAIEPFANSRKICMNPECPPYVRQVKVIRWVAAVVIFSLLAFLFYHP